MPGYGAIFQIYVGVYLLLFQYFGYDEAQPIVLFPLSSSPNYGHLFLTFPGAFSFPAQEQDGKVKMER